jgi:hypothetical protein
VSFLYDECQWYGALTFVVKLSAKPSFFNVAQSCTSTSVSGYFFFLRGGYPSLHSQKPFKARETLEM